MVREPFWVSNSLLNLRRNEFYIILMVLCKIKIFCVSISPRRGCSNETSRSVRYSFLTWWRKWITVVLPVADEFKKNEFSYVLSKRTYHSISNGHLWFSIFSRPPSNRFTRVQRCTCCFVFLFISMLLNIMYYDLRAEDVNTSTDGAGLALGSFFITLQ
jgi:hypothetical protein